MSGPVEIVGLRHHDIVDLLPGSKQTSLVGRGYAHEKPAWQVTKVVQNWLFGRQSATRLVPLARIRCQSGAECTKCGSANTQHFRRRFYIATRYLERPLNGDPIEFRIAVPAIPQNGPYRGGNMLGSDLRGSSRPSHQITVLHCGLEFANVPLVLPFSQQRYSRLSESR